MACTEKGRDTLIQRRLVPDIRRLFDDQEVKIRHNAYTCLINLAQFTHGIDSVIEYEILPVLVDKLVLEK